ncbi:hypothetical protein KSF_101220 [Reticulibacter mediterranei]|uniref:Uncharacterized protein n=1 Tax=Reticulibacter mediterranei TaxID=2778369 RepID=A0A8J3N6D0_9CHLR|nr:hypothetical protein [Reticulibacter mediterranei]GHP00075.1 hypothetical protein KSF_101220 [Reticulibacter mediterranei]
MRKATQVFLLLFAIGALFATGVAFYRIVLAATIHGAPVRFVDTKAGVYPLKVAFYADPINAGDVIPFAIASTSAQGKLHYTVTATPGSGVLGSLTQSDINDQQSTPYGTPGSITFVTRGDWTMHIAVTGPSGQGQADIPIVAASPSVIPAWLAWNIGLLPLYGLLIFWGAQIVRKRNAQMTTPGAVTFLR